jgi:hypothetical protein
MLLGAFRGGNPLERIVAKPPTESGRHAVSHKSGMGVHRPSEANTFVNTCRVVGTDPLAGHLDYFRIAEHTIAGHIYAIELRVRLVDYM